MNLRKAYRRKAVKGMGLCSPSNVCLKVYSIKEVHKVCQFLFVVGDYLTTNLRIMSLAHWVLGLRIYYKCYQTQIFLKTKG